MTDDVDGKTSMRDFLTAAAQPSPEQKAIMSLHVALCIQRGEEPMLIGLSFIHSQGFKEFAAIQRAIFLDKSMAAKAAVSTRWMEISPARRILCSQTRRNSLSGKRLDTIAEESTLTNEELLVDVQSGFDNISNLEFVDSKNGTITQRKV